MIIEFPNPADAMSLNKMPTTKWRAVQWRQLKNAWKEAAYWAAMQQLPGGPKGRQQPPCDIWATIPVPGNYRRDPHNVTPTMKPIVDGLVLAGVWPDDTPEWVDVHTPELVVVKPTELARSLVRIRLEPK